MSQTFILKPATDSLIGDAKKIGVTTQQLMQIEVKVTAEIYQDAEVSATQASLSLNYDIRLSEQTLSEQLHWPSWHKNNIGFNDYLWEQTCLECFITDNKTGYIEINASPNGQYAIYQFEDYRSPETLPPNRLLLDNHKNQASIEWTNRSVTNIDAQDTYQRSFHLPLAQLPYDLLSKSITAFIHPCVILYFGETALYFAMNHASPADFHHRQYWSAFDNH